MGHVLDRVMTDLRRSMQEDDQRLRDYELAEQQVLQDFGQGLFDADTLRDAFDRMGAGWWAELQESLRKNDSLRAGELVRTALIEHLIELELDYL